jgi:formylglycine-generating enzyme required for sulfatase activity
MKESEDESGRSDAGAGRTGRWGLLLLSLSFGCSMSGDDSAKSRGSDPSSYVESTSGIEFVLIDASTFDMGCSPYDPPNCMGNATPVRTTTLTRDYYISRTEVTQDQFEAVIGYNPSYFSSCVSPCPVEEVSWHQSAAFANALSSAAGLASCYTCTGRGSTVNCTAPSDPYGCTGYRLPTEAEWEGAARCGEDLLYAGSDVVDEVAWYEDNTVLPTHAVGGLAPNACGLYDMSGNVHEWVNDWYKNEAYSGGAATDPTGPSSGTYRVMRGGGRYSEPYGVTVADRNYWEPGDRHRTLGIRLVRTAP